MATRRKPVAVTTAPLSESTEERPEEKDDEIDVTATEDDEEEGGLEAEGEEEPKVTARRQRRYDRLQKLSEKTAEEAAERIRAAEERAQRAELAAAHAQGLRDADTARQQSQQEDPHEAAIKAARARKEELRLLYESLPAEQQAAQYADLQAKVNQANEAEIEAVQNRNLQRQGIGRPQDPGAVYRAQVLEEIAGDILRSPQNVQQWGLARVRQLIMEGYPDNKETAALAAEQTRKQFGMPLRNQNGRKPQVSRSTMTSVSSNGAGGNGEGERQTVKMSPEFKKMAHARFPNLGPAEAEKKWAAHFARHQKTQGA